MAAENFGDEDIGIYTENLFATDLTFVGATTSSGVEAGGISSASIWNGGLPPEENPLTADQADGTTSGLVRLERDKPLTRVGASRKFVLNDPAPLLSSIPVSWGGTASYEYILKNTAGERLDPLYAGWTVRRTGGYVDIRSAFLIEQGPFTLTYYAYNGPLVSDVPTAGGGSSGESFPVVQAAHGFAVGRAVYADGAGVWQLAAANATGSRLATHLVSAVASANEFEVKSTGAVGVPAHGLGASGTELYLQTGAGLLGPIPPPNAVPQRVARVLDANTLDAFSPAAGGVVPVTDYCPPLYPGAITGADLGGAMTLEEVGASPPVNYYHWRAGAGGKFARVAKTFTVPRGAYAIQANGVGVAIRTSQTNPAGTGAPGDGNPASRVTMQLLDQMGGLLGSAEGSSAGSPLLARQLTIAAVAATFTANTQVRVALTLEADSGEHVWVGPITIVWLTRAAARA